MGIHLGIHFKYPGSPLGSAVDSPPGISLSRPLGSYLGCCMGSCPRNHRLGSQLGNFLGSPLWKFFFCLLGSCLGSRLERRRRNHLGSHLGSHLRSHLGSTVAWRRGRSYKTRFWKNGGSGGCSSKCTGSLELDFLLCFFGNIEGPNIKNGTKNREKRSGNPDCNISSFSFFT